MIDDLIRLLEAIRAEHGNLPVYFYDGEYGEVQVFKAAVNLPNSLVREKHVELTAKNDFLNKSVRTAR